MAYKESVVELHLNKDSITYQQSLLLHQHAQIPSGVSIGLGFINDDGVEQTLSAHRLNKRALKTLKSSPEQVTELLCPLNHTLLAHDLERTNGDGATKWVSAVGGPVGPGLDREHDVLAAQHARDRVHTARDGLAEQDKIGLDVAPLVAEQLTRAGNTSLDLITNQQHVVLVAERASFL